MYRETASAPFTFEEATLINRVATVLAQGLRRDLVSRAPGYAKDSLTGPATIVLDRDLAVVTATTWAQRWLDDQHPPLWSSASFLPPEVHVVIARLGALGNLGSLTNPTARLVSRTADGQWLAIHAAQLSGAGGSEQVAITIDRPRPAEILSLILHASGLTARERV